MTLDLELVVNDREHSGFRQLMSLASVCLDAVKQSPPRSAGDVGDRREVDEMQSGEHGWRSQDEYL